MFISVSRVVYKLRLFFLYYVLRSWRWKRKTDIVGRKSKYGNILKVILYIRDNFKRHTAVYVDRPNVYIESLEIGMFFLIVYSQISHMSDWHPCQICYPLEIKLLLLLLLLLLLFDRLPFEKILTLPIFLVNIKENTRQVKNTSIN